MQRLLVNGTVVAAMLAIEFALRAQGVPFGWRVVAMGVTSAILLAAVTWRRRRG